MKSYFQTALFVLLALSINIAAGAQSNKEAHLDEVAVTMAVVPFYPTTALHSHTSGEAVIEVKINPEGAVIAAEGISGHPLLVGGSKSTARRWKFAPATAGKNVRIVKLTFVYHLAPRNTPREERFAVFRPPYQVEITQVLPDATPLP